MRGCDQDSTNVKNDERASLTVTLPFAYMVRKKEREKLSRECVSLALSRYCIIVYRKIAIKMERETTDMIVLISYVV